MVEHVGNELSCLGAAAKRQAKVGGALPHRIVSGIFIEDREVLVQSRLGSAFVQELFGFFKTLCDLRHAHYPGTRLGFS